MEDVAKLKFDVLLPPEETVDGMDVLFLLHDICQ